MIGIPGIIIPIGFTDGLPCGMELDGLAGQDKLLLAVAASMDEVFGLPSES